MSSKRRKEILQNCKGENKKMKFYEKAIAEFKKAEKKRCKNNIDVFIESVVSFANDGSCYGIHCEDCPMKVYQRERKCVIFCNDLSAEQRRKIITSEVF